MKKKSYTGVSIYTFLEDVIIQIEVSLVSGSS